MHPAPADAGTGDVWRRFRIGMSDKFEYYRTIAAYCDRMFREARTMEMKTSWLRLAMNWRALIPQTAQHDNGEPAAQPVQPTQPAE